MRKGPDARIVVGERLPDVVDIRANGRSEMIDGCAVLGDDPVTSQPSIARAPKGRRRTGIRQEDAGRVLPGPRRAGPDRIKSI
jgi:hypothetical protein